MAEDPTATPPTLARTTAPNTDHTRHPLCRISQTLTWLYKQTSMFPICTLLLALSRVLVLLIPSVSCLYCAILNFVPIRFSVSVLSRRDKSAAVRYVILIRTVDVAYWPDTGNCTLLKTERKWRSQKVKIIIICKQVLLKVKIKNIQNLIMASRTRIIKGIYVSVIKSF